MEAQGVGGRADEAFDSAMEAFRISEKQARKQARQMWEFVNPRGKSSLEEAEALELSKICYLGTRTSHKTGADELRSWIIFHGGRREPGRVSFEEFEQLVVRLLTLSERDRQAELRRRREELRRYREQLQEEVAQAVGRTAIESELRQGMSLFDKYDINKNGFLEEFEIPAILVDTYAAMNVEYQPTPEDVSNYIRSMDIDNDGMVSRTEYEVFLLEALNSRGIRLHNISGAL